ncbi:MAG: hypothetical protein J6K04_01260 [Lachnospiraceae bacterium]|nr:hypothetical protein [Lachnospiraceae bacterium]
MKTKLGISVTMLAVTAYLLGLFSGYLALVLVAGYVLLCETDEWLKKSVVKALVVCLAFSLVSALIGFIPNAISLVDDLLNIFGGNFSIGFISRIVVFINTVLSVLQKLLMLGLAAMAASNKTIKLPVIDDILDKNM